MSYWSTRLAADLVSFAVSRKQLRNGLPNRSNFAGPVSSASWATFGGSLKEGGLLFYSTCSYSPRENEVILYWLCGTVGAESLPLSLDPGWGVVVNFAPLSGALGYRFYPNRLEKKMLSAVFAKDRGAGVPSKRAVVQGLVRVDAREAEVITPWIELCPIGIPYDPRLGEKHPGYPGGGGGRTWTLIAATLPGSREAGVALGQLKMRQGTHS